MENIFLIKQLRWVDFMKIALLLIALYYLLKLVLRGMSSTHFLGQYQERVKNAIHHLLLIYETIVILLLGTTFVLINPVFHGLIILILTIGGFTHIKNYIAGRVVRFNQSFSIGKQLKTQKVQGIIAHLGRLGLQLKTGRGSHFINYSTLIENGYLLISGKEIGGFYKLNIRPKNPESRPNHIEHINDLLAVTPYLDWSHKPELIPSLNHPHEMQATVLVKEERHLFDFITLIKEWGYDCKILKK